MSAIGARIPLPPRRKGWCPGALKPMETGDGLLARVRAPRARLSLDQAEALAGAATACGNGSIGLSARANLHLRGLSEGALPELHARLEHAGLIDADPEVERLRNIVSSPLDDLDPDAAFDLAESVEALETRLKEDRRLRALPAKFSFILDAGGRLPLGDVEADIRFEAQRNGTFAVFLGGEDALAVDCAPRETGEIAARLGRAFMTLAGSGEAGPRRMRALIERRGSVAVFADAGREVKPRARSPRRASLRDVLGAQVFGASVFVAAAAPFGEFEAARFKALIARARSLGATGLKLTPWRAFIIVGLKQNEVGPDRGRHCERSEAIQKDAGRPAILDRRVGPKPVRKDGRLSTPYGPPRDDGSSETHLAADPRVAASMVEACETLGFICDPGDPRLRVAACPGAPACMHGARPAREDAARWAPLLPKGEGVVLHVSGCAKGCARPAATAATLTATATGYDLIVAGKAADQPVRRGLKSAEVAELLTRESALLFGAGGRR